MEAKGWQDERLKVMVLQAVALQRAHGEKDQAVQLLGEALALAEPGGFIRLFVDEGEPMRLLILDFRLRLKSKRAARVRNCSVTSTSCWLLLSNRRPCRPYRDLRQSQIHRTVEIHS